MGSGYGARLLELEETAHRDVLELLARGRYRSTPTRVISLEEVPGALRDMRERRTLGRVVARVSSTAHRSRGELLPEPEVTARPALARRPPRTTAGNS